MLTDYELVAPPFTFTHSLYIQGDAAAAMELDDDPGAADRFSCEEVQKYIRYARTIKPKISEDSKKWFVRYYRQLRQRDQSEQACLCFHMFSGFELASLLLDL